MSAKQTFDYQFLLETSRQFVADGRAKQYTDLARLLKVNIATLRQGLERNFGIRNFKEITGNQRESRSLIGGEQDDKLDVEIDGNFAMVRSVTVLDQIKTVAQLMKITGMSQADWEVLNPKIKKWDVALKLRDGADKEIVQVVPSIYIEAPLRARHPKAFEPVIQPIQIDLPKLPKIRKSTKGVRRALIVDDPQVGFRRTLHTSDLIPFHDRRVLDLALQIAQTEQIDHISFGGDCLDLSEWSTKFMPEPEFFWTTQPALLEWSWWMTQFRMAQPGAEIKALEGNHDVRMPNLIATNMRQAYKLRAVDELNLPPAMSVPRLLALHKLNIEYVDHYPDNGYWLNQNVFITHGDVVRGNPGDTAKAIVNKQAFTTVFGHIHRRESVTRRMKTHGEDLIYTAFCPGCACRTDGTVPGSSSKDQWQNGIAVIEYTETGENIIPIAVRDGSMVYNGSQWQAREREAEVNKFLVDSLKETNMKHPSS
jgi:hypothetical protein